MRTYSKYINPYMEKILNNEIEHCLEQEEMIKNIVIPVLEREDVYIDEKKIEDGLSLQKYFPYKLIEWEVFLFALIVGVFLKDGDIFFKDIRCIVGRGSGKNGFISFLCFYFLSPYHGIKGYNIDLLANSEQQAMTSFNDVYEIIKEPADKKYEGILKKHYYATKTQIMGKKTKSILRYNTSSKRGKDSKRTGCVIYDEKHEYQDSTNINTLKSGLGKVWHGREITISTNGHTRGGVLDRELDQAKEILKEYNPLNRTLIFWCKIEEEKEWDNPDKWIKAIPSINDFKSLKSTIQKEVIDMPYNLDYFPEFMAKRLNFPIGDKDVEVAEWKDILATNQEFIDLKGLDCVGGVDYAKTNDFVACCLVFKVKEKYYVKQHTFVCTKSRDLRGIKAPLDDWARRGDITFIDDVEISAVHVTDWFLKMGSLYNVLKIGIDNFRYSLLNNEFKKIGFDAFELKNIKLIRPNDILKVSPIINSVFVNHNFVWGDSPILRWYTNNTKKIISNGNISYGKIEPNYRKTDGFMAMVNAMILAQTEIKERVKAPKVGVLTF
ncbi:terminase TerL endonuclease subunit [Sarcina ventriculi]